MCKTAVDSLLHTPNCGLDPQPRLVWDLAADGNCFPWTTCIFFLKKLFRLVERKIISSTQILFHKVYESHNLPFALASRERKQEEIHFYRFIHKPELCSYWKILVFRSLDGWATAWCPDTGCVSLQMPQVGAGPRRLGQWVKFLWTEESLP